MLNITMEVVILWLLWCDIAQNSFRTWALNFDKCQMLFVVARPRRQVFKFAFLTTVLISAVFLRSGSVWEDFWTPRKGKECVKFRGHVYSRTGFTVSECTVRFTPWTSPFRHCRKAPVFRPRSNRHCHIRMMTELSTRSLTTSTEPQ